METGVVFKEEQKFKQWWLWSIMAILNGVIIFNLLNNAIKKNNNQTGMIITAIIIVLITIFLYSIKLKTRIFKDSVEIIFFPFGIHKTYTLKNIEKIEVTKYNPFLEYGGWGIRIGAYTISGNKGLKMYYAKDTYKDVILIGTQKPEELSKIIKHLKDA